MFFRVALNRPVDLENCSIQDSLLFLSLSSTGFDRREREELSSYSLPEKVFHSFLSLGRRNFSSREGGKKRRGENLSFNCFCLPAPKSSLGRPPLFPSASELGTNSFFIRSQRGEVLPGKRRRQKKSSRKKRVHQIPWCGEEKTIVRNKSGIGGQTGAPGRSPIPPPQKKSQSRIFEV